MENKKEMYVLCSGYKKENKINECYKIKRRGVWYNLEQELMKDLIYHIKTNDYKISHGICPSCLENTIKEANKNE